MAKNSQNKANNATNAQTSNDATSKNSKIVQSLKQAMHLRTNPQILLRMQITATRTV